MLTSMASALLTNSQTDDPEGALRSCRCPCAGAGTSRAERPARESRCDTPPEVFAKRQNRRAARWRSTMF
jgi:hypothetical protein